MDRRWLPLNALRAFEAVGKHLSFTAAANELLVSQSAVSRHVISLEGLIGRQLFDRRSTGLALTEAGELLLPVVRRALDRMSAALDTVKAADGGAGRPLHVRLPPTFAHQLAIPILRDFRGDFPDIGLDIDSLNPGSGETAADIAVIYSEPKVSDHVLDLLWMERLTPLCHPAVAARAPGAALARLIADNDLLHVKLDGHPRHQLWEMFARSHGGGALDVARGLVFDSAQLAVKYALSGDGLALVDPRLFETEIAEGRLARPTDRSVASGYGYYLSIQPDDLAEPRVAMFRSWLIRRFAGVG